MKTLKLTTLVLIGAAGLMLRATAQDAEPVPDESAASAEQLDTTNQPADEPAMAEEEPGPADAMTPAQGGGSGADDATIAELRRQIEQLQQALQQRQAVDQQFQDTMQQFQGNSQPMQFEQGQGQNGETAPPQGFNRGGFNRGGFDQGGFGQGGFGPGGRGPRGRQNTEQPFTAPTTATSTNGPADWAPGESDATIRLNFRNADLNQVLTYLSQAAGFVIVLQTPVRGTVDVWSEHPVTRSEAVRALDAALQRNGYGVIREGNMLTVYGTNERTNPGIKTYTVGTNEVPRSAEIVTAIIPVGFVSASEVMQNVAPLLPNPEAMTANTSGNSLVLTDTLSTVRRIVEVVRALDKPMSSGTSTLVVPLTYADATSLQQVIQNLYRDQGNNNRGNNPFQRFFQNRGRGGRGGRGRGG